MLINAGVTHPARAWLDQLAVGGRMILPLTVPVGSTGLGKGMMVKIVRAPAGSERIQRLSARVITLVAIYSCSSARDGQIEQAIGKSFATGTLMKMKSVRVDTHEAGETCVHHPQDVCISAAELGRS